MVKELFEIEPIQKNSIIIIAGLFCLSYLQLNIFDNHLNLNDVFPSVVISLALSICWFILNSISAFLFFEYLSFDKNSDGVMYDKTILFLGYLSLTWVTLLTYIGYELELDFKSFIRLSIIISLIRTSFWGCTILYMKKQKKKKSSNNNTN